MASFPKSDTEEIRVELREVKRQSLVDIRVYTMIPGLGEKVPTGQGFSFGISRLKDLKTALLAAERFLEEKQKV